MEALENRDFEKISFRDVLLPPHQPGDPEPSHEALVENENVFSSSA